MIGPWPIEELVREANINPSPEEVELDRISREFYARMATDLLAPNLLFDLIAHPCLAKYGPLNPPPFADYIKV